MDDDPGFDPTDSPAYRRTVHAGVDSATLAWRSLKIRACRGFALKRKIKRAAGNGFVEKVMASWVGSRGRLL